MRKRIDAYFESKTLQEVEEILGSYGIEIEQEKPTLNRLYQRVQELREFAMEVNCELEIVIKTFIDGDYYRNIKGSSISINVKN